MNKVSNQLLVKSEVSFDVTIPGLTEKDIPDIDENNRVYLDGGTECISYAYKIERSPARKTSERGSVTYASCQYIMFVLHLAANCHVHNVFITYNKDTNSLSFKMDFGTEFDDFALKFFGFLYLDCETRNMMAANY